METILINIDSKYRDVSKYTHSNKFNIILDNTYKNITSIKMSSFEMCNNNIQYLNYNNISSLKNNNYFKVHIPNKLNDPNGTILYVDDGLNDINLLINNISLKLNNLQNNEKYFYIFYLNNNTTINFDFMNDKPNKLILNSGWYSLYGIVQVISQYITNIYNDKQNNNLTKYYFQILPFDLNIFDRRFKNNNCIRTDNIPLIEFNDNNFTSAINHLKDIFYHIYIDDTTNFNVSIEGNGILDKLVSGTFDENITLNSKYHINSNNDNNLLLYNFVINTELMHIVINNDYSNYYFNNNNNWESITNLLDKDYLLNNNFLSISPLNSYKPILTSNMITLSQFNNYKPLLNKDIPTFDIDFKINDIYTSLGYYLGFNRTSLLSSKYENTIQYIKSQYIYNLNSHNYIFLNLNNWGYINLKNKYLLSKIIFNTNTYNNEITFVNNQYNFRQPINIKNLEIELFDYNGELLDLDDIDFSFTIELSLIVNMEDKYIYERNNNNILR